MRTPLRRLMEPLSSLRGDLLVPLPNNLDADDISWLQKQLLSRLGQGDGLHGVLFDFTAVTCTDANDLAELQSLLETLQECQTRVALAGIGAGLAALIVRAELLLPHDVVGQDLDAVLDEI